MNVVGIRFKKAGKIYFFDANGIDLAYKDMALINTDNGLEMGEVALENFDFEYAKDLKTVARKANSDDMEIHAQNIKDAKDALISCQQKADYLDLNMKIVDAEYTFDRNKLTFCFTADKRVDFRELVKDLASTFRSRIELRQIGVRDHAKLIKHHGTCGQECCCSRHLTDFAPLTIKYAKDQNISLDPTKISGVCGRLMCCLSFEQDYYLEAKKIMPKYGEKVITCEGEGVVTGSDLIKSRCKVKLNCEDEDEMVEKLYNIEDLERIKKN